MQSLTLLDEKGNELIRWDEVVKNDYDYELPCSPVVKRLTIAYTLADGVICFVNSGSGMGILSPDSGNRYRWVVDVSKPERKTFAIQLFPSGKRYTVVTDKRYSFFNLVTEHLGNLRVVINNPEVNDDSLKFDYCEWHYKNDNGYWDVKAGNTFYISAGSSVTNTFHPNDSMYVKLRATNGKTITTCPNVTTLLPDSLDFDTYVAVKLGSVMVYNNRRLIDRGYHVRAFRWYGNGELLATGSTYALSAAGMGFPPSVVYHFEADTPEGAIRSTDKRFPDLSPVVANAEGSGRLLLYPNPLPPGASLNVYTGAWDAEERELLIYSAAGNLVLRQRFSGAFVTLPFATPAGVYLLRVGSRSGKLLVGVSN